MGEAVDAKQVFQDPKGRVSAIRVLMLVWGIGVLAVWAFATIMGIVNGVTPAPVLSGDIVTILLGITGVKGVQRFAENREK